MQPPLTKIEEPVKRTPAKKKGYLVVAILAAIFLVAAIIGIAVRIDERHALARETEKMAVPVVDVVHPAPEPPQSELVLPSTLQAYIESPIYARTNGYLGRWYKDIGSRVRAGELLATIETPEVDQELVQARAARDQAEAQLKLAESSAQRWQNLEKMDAVSQQETDERSSSYRQAQANLAAAAANLKRLEQLESFKHIEAPFSGVVTRRNTDVGALVNAGNGGPSQELFVIAQVDPIRVYVDVPENDSPSVHPGVPAEIEVPELPSERFSGKVVRTADAIDPSTRTLHTEIDVPNRHGRLLPGAYAQVHFALEGAIRRLIVPANTLLFRAEGPRAAVVGGDGKVQLRPVVIGRDFGTTVEIVSGITPADSVVVSPSDSLEEGQAVEISSPERRP
jgi:membrane fusion protein, multidrug efflux system